MTVRAAVSRGETDCFWRVFPFTHPVPYNGDDDDDDDLSEHCVEPARFRGLSR